MQGRQLIPPAPPRCISLVAGGSSGRGRMSPSNGKVSHSSTGGIRSDLAARAYNCSGVSGNEAIVTKPPERSVGYAPARWLSRSADRFAVCRPLKQGADYDPELLQSPLQQQPVFGSVQPPAGTGWMWKGNQ